MTADLAEQNAALRRELARARHVIACFVGYGHAELNIRKPGVSTRITELRGFVAEGEKMLGRNGRAGENGRGE